MEEQAEIIAQSISLTFEYPTGKNKNTISSGDVVTISGETMREQFYVISEPGASTVKLLAKYAIIADPQSGDFLEQKSNAPGQPIKKDNEKYWTTDAANDGCTGNLYNKPYDLPTTIYPNESGEKIAMYAAMKYGEKYGVTGRLMTRGEFNKLSGYEEADNTQYTTPVSWLKTNTTGGSFVWWLGSAKGDNGVWCVFSGGYLSSYIPNSANGVRPVLEFSVSNMS